MCEKPSRCRMCNSIYTEDYTAGFCVSCWEKEYEFKKQFYLSYKKRLDSALNKTGITTTDAIETGIKEYGTPELDIIEYDWMEGVHLRKDERAIYTVACRNCIFGLPYNGIGLRYLYVSQNKDDQKWAKDVDVSRDVLAVTSDKNDLYWLTEEGIVKSTKSEWQEISIFNNIEECRRICAGISKESVKAYIHKLESTSDYSEYNIFNIQHHTYYDANAKVFFTVFADGNYYHGYDVSYFVHSKKEVLERILSYGHESLCDIARCCSKKLIPAFVVADMLEVDEGISKYEPPTDVGYGSIYV